MFDRAYVTCAECNKIVKFSKYSQLLISSRRQVINSKMIRIHSFDFLCSYDCLGEFNVISLDNISIPINRFDFEEQVKECVKDLRSVTMIVNNEYVIIEEDDNIPSLMFLHEDLVEIQPFIDKRVNVLIVTSASNGSSNEIC